MMANCSLSEISELGSCQWRSNWPCIRTKLPNFIVTCPCFSPDPIQQLSKMVILNQDNRYDSRQFSLYSDNHLLIQLQKYSSLMPPENKSMTLFFFQITSLPFLQGLMARRGDIYIVSQQTNPTSFKAPPPLPPTAPQQNNVRQLMIYWVVL